MKYLLDTDTCIYALKQNAALLRQLLANRRDDIAVSVITEAGLRTGAIKSTNPSKNLQRVENFLQPLSIIEFTSTDAACYGKCARSSSGRVHPLAPWTP
jgi:tRNA(fMet)-specific endonuclease VapC